MMIKENDNESLSRLFDGDLGAEIPGVLTGKIGKFIP